MREISESIEITDDEIEEFVEHGGSDAAPSYHPILQIWREVLKPGHDERLEPITAGFANKIVSSYREITFADMGEYRDRYFDKIAELETILLEEIASDEDCLTYTSPEEDVEHNSQHYKNLLLNWQLAIVQWEKEWDFSAPDAGVEIAAISEVHKMFFSDTGLTAFLDNIQFQFTDADRQELAEAIQALKDGQ